MNINCLDNPNLYICQNLLLDSDFKLYNTDASKLDINIIKTPNDFITFINSVSVQRPV